MSHFGKPPFAVLRRAARTWYKLGVLYPIKLSGLSSILASEVRRRVAAGEITGAGLARRTLLAQCSVSNWLRGRKTLSLAACECVLAALRLDLIEVLRGRLVDGIGAPRLRARVVSIDRPASGREPAPARRAVGAA